MTQHNATSSLSLGLGETMRLVAAPDRSVHVLDGTVWITFGDERDVILEAGDSARLDTSGPIIVSALVGAARLEVVTSAAERLAA